jgi:WD40 repeat protein
VNFSPDGASVATVGEDGVIKIWEASTGREKRSFSARGGYLRTVEFSHDGQRLATAGQHSVQIWNAATGELLRTLPGRERGVFSPDGSRLAAFDSNTPLAITIWDSSNGRELVTLPGHPNALHCYCLAFSRNGRRLASGAYDNAVKVWDVDKGSQVYHLTGHSCAVTGLSFSPDGRRLLSASCDPYLPMKKGEIIVWDLETGQEILTLKEFADGVPCLALSRDGHQLASGGRDALLKIWDARPHSDEERHALEMPLSRRDAEAAAASNQFETTKAVKANNLAWKLATASDPKRGDPVRAVELARKAVELAPKEGLYARTLGIAYYRAGNWEAARLALDQSIALGFQRGSNQFFLAMTHWQLGSKDEARQWYDKAVAWMEKNMRDNDELRRFRAEAKELLGIK